MIPCHSHILSWGHSDHVDMYINMGDFYIICMIYKDFTWYFTFSFSWLQCGIGLLVDTIHRQKQTFPKLRQYMIHTQRTWHIIYRIYVVGMTPVSYHREDISEISEIRQSPLHIKYALGELYINPWIFCIQEINGKRKTCSDDFLFCNYMIYNQWFK